MGNNQPHHLAVRFDSTSLDSVIRAACSTYHIPGVATWTSKNGQVIWRQCYGYANLEDSIPVADTTLFMLASISKTVTATAIMQLWERGVFGLDDDINNYLPFNVRNPNYPDSIITFRMLMTHTSSINDNMRVYDSLYVWGGDSPIPLGSFLEDYLVPGGVYYDSAANYRWWAPGRAFNYCNVAVGLLGYLVQVIADSFPVYCQDSIFGPLSMNETSWFLAGLDTNQIAVPYHWTGSYYQPYQHYGFPTYPDGQLRTSILQLARHLTAFMQYGMIDSVRILDSTTVELMRTIQYQITPNWMTGLIWMYWNPSTRWLWFHDGDDYGVSTVAAFCPAESSAVIVLTNGESWPGTQLIMNALFDYAQTPGIVEDKSSSRNIRASIPTIVHGVLNLQSEIYNLKAEIKLLDITGRKVADLKAGANDIRHLAPGVYFIRSKNNNQVTKIIVTK